jgi:Icc-related predicted phosphoesterase
VRGEGPPVGERQRLAVRGVQLEGERPEIAAFLGCDRLAHPIADHCPDLVLHGHAHAGRFSGSIGEVPVYNVSIPVMGRDFWLFELDVSRPAQTPIH